jgi:hypothetical protein
MRTLRLNAAAGSSITAFFSTTDNADAEPAAFPRAASTSVIRSRSGGQIERIEVLSIILTR